MKIWHEKIGTLPNYSYNIIDSNEEPGFPPHWHNQIEVVYIFEGEQIIGLNGEDYQLKPRDILLISSFDVHNFYPEPPYNKKIILQFEEAIFEPYQSAIFGKRFKSPLISPGQQTGKDIVLHDLLEKMIMKLVDERNKKEYGYEITTRAIVTDFAGALVRYAPMISAAENDDNDQKKPVEKIAHIFRYIESAYQTEISLQKAAEITGFSVYHFSRIFKEIAEISFIEYLNEFRVMKAAGFLLRTDEKITDIAYRTGFNSIQTFNRVFKEVTGCTPSAYRSKK